MNIDLQLRLSTVDQPWLCFRHAVTRALLFDADVKLDISDFGSEYYMGTTTCGDCADERNLPAEATLSEALEEILDDGERREVAVRNYLLARQQHA